MKQSRRISRDPYYYWKILNMVLACGILLLAILILFGGKEGIIVSAAFLLGAVMCSFSGIMELAKGKRVTGYICSVFAGLMTVALILSVIFMW